MSDYEVLELIQKLSALLMQDTTAPGLCDVTYLEEAAEITDHDGFPFLTTQLIYTLELFFFEHFKFKGFKHKYDARFRKITEKLPKTEIVFI